MVRFGRTVEDGFLPVFSVDTEDEAKQLLTKACPVNYEGEFIAEELVKEQTLENLELFSQRLEKTWNEFFKVILNEKLKLPNIKKIAIKIKKPLESWPRNCNLIASLIVNLNIIKGKVRYGLYHGFIDDKSIFGERSFTHHAWIEVDNNYIVDPTRWVFENKKPYFYYGLNSREYDIGGLDLQFSMRKMPNIPKIKEKTQPHPPKNILQDLNACLKRDLSKGVSMEELFWISNAPPRILGNKSEKIYKWIKRIGKVNLIPIDLQDMYNL